MGVFRRSQDDERSKAKRRPLLFNVRSSKWFILTVVGTAIFMDLFLYGIVVPILPFALRSRVGIASGDVQHWVSVMLAVYSVGLLASSPFWGWYADRTKSRAIPFILGLIALIGATALLCVGSSIAIIVVGRLLQGISAALVWTVGLAIVSDTVGKENLAEAMGWVTMGIGGAVLTGPMLGGIIFARAGYYAVFAVAFGLLALDVLLRLLMIEKSVALRYEAAEENAQPQSIATESKLPSISEPSAESEVATHTQQKRKLPTMITLLRSYRLATALWGCLVAALLFTSFDSVLPIYVNKIFGWDSTGAGLIFICLCITSFFDPILGRIADNVGHRWMVVGGFASAMPFFVLLRLVTYDSIPQKVLLCALLTLIGLAMSCVIPPLLAEVTLTVTDREREEPGIFGDKSAFGQAYALFNVAYAAGSLIGPLWAGFITLQAGWGTMVWTLGLLSAVTAVPAAIWTGASALDIARRGEVQQADEDVERIPASDVNEEVGI